MSNNFDILEALWLRRERKRRAQKTIEGAPPLTYTAKNAGTLKNYRIYGNTVNSESVGDRTGNILPMSITPIDTIIDDFHCEYDGMGTIKLTALTDNAVLSSFTVPLSKNFTIPVSIGQGGTGCWQLNNDAAYKNANNAASFCLNLKDDTQLRDNWTLSVINRISATYSAMGGANINAIQILTTVGATTNIQSGQTLTISPAFVENVAEQVPFEPYGYRVPVTVSNGTDTLTTNIYLPEQIRKVGDEAEYIDYAEQKLHRVRKNLWSGVVEQGNVSQYGVYGEDTKRIRSKNVPLEPGTYTISANVLIRMIYAYNDDDKIGLCASISDGSYSRSFTVPAGANNISIGMMMIVDKVQVDITPSDFIWGQIEKGSKATTYEPYIENTNLDVTLPALPTIAGTNTLSVGTQVQPSKVIVKGKLKD